ncbi:MAG: Protein YggU, DUF167 family [Candidatus Methanohalarchaeum thermophilum]|uniref:UPF0235 protein BTN85_0067 n=1 Tax=Methanohalarchaeum thermophilum TaxID=1903181 RepID=A0A1Q6DTB1_METT1|nr:MAG: Protein YggU, DUF167 family [Candidatus Methanohalarchaeum thermophilum]
MKKAINSKGNLTIIDIKVNPGTQENKIKEYNKWREQIKINIKEQATKNKANRELKEYLSDILSIPSKSINIKKGKTSPQKVVEVSGLTEDKVLKKLKKAKQN